jgi:hypothetical protein
LRLDFIRPSLCPKTHIVLIPRVAWGQEDAGAMGNAVEYIIVGLYTLMYTVQFFMWETDSLYVMCDSALSCKNIFVSAHFIRVHPAEQVSAWLWYLLNVC